MRVLLITPFKYLAMDDDTRDNYDRSMAEFAWLDRRISNYDKILYRILVASSMFGMLGALSHRR